MFGPFTRMSETVGSAISGSSGPRPSASWTQIIDQSLPIGLAQQTGVAATELFGTVPQLVAELFRVQRSQHGNVELPDQSFVKLGFEQQELLLFISRCRHDSCIHTLTKRECLVHVIASLC